MFSRVSLVGMIASFLIIGFVSLAHGAFNDSTQLVLDSNFQQVGDPPKPISVSYDVELSKSLLAKSKTAHLEFIVLHGSHARVVINGHRLQIPYSGQLEVWEASEAGSTVIPVPLAYFQAGNNTVVFEAGRGFWTSTNIYDDYRYGEVALIFSH